MSPFQRVSLIFVGGAAGALVTGLLTVVVCLSVEAVGSWIDGDWRTFGDFTRLAVSLVGSFGTIQGLVTGLTYPRLLDGRFLYELAVAPFAVIGLLQSRAGDLGVYLLAVALLPGGLIGWWVAGWFDVSRWTGLGVGMATLLLIANTAAMHAGRIEAITAES